MGKVKSAKKGVQPAAPVQQTQQAPRANNANVNALEADLASLEESNRHKACMLLADLYMFNISNKFSLDTLTSSSILNKLGVRLVDASVKVRVQGASALKNLSECRDPTIMKRLVNLGIIRSVVSLSVETLTGGNLAQSDNVAFVESLLHTLANAVTSSDLAIKEILSANADFISGLFSMITVDTPADVVSAVANLLIIIAGNTSGDLIIGGNGAFPAKMEQLWTFIETLNGLKNATPEALAGLKLFSVLSEEAQLQQQRSSKQPGGINEAHEQRAFQLNVIMVECLEVVISIYAHASYSAQLAEVCRINRALLLLNLELHTSLNGIEVTKADATGADNERPGRKDSVASMETDASAMNAPQNELQLRNTTEAANQVVAVANMKRLGLCKTLAGVLSELLETLGDSSDPTASSTQQQGQQQKATAVAGLLWEHQAYATLLQCYNAAFYFLSSSTVPRPVPAPTAGGTEAMDTMDTEGTAPGGSDSGSVDRATAMVNAIAITPQVIEGLDCCDQLASTLGQVFGLLASHGAAQLRESSLVDVSLYLQLLQPLIDLVAHTSPVTVGMGTAWSAPYFLEQGVTENGFRRSLLSSCSALIDFLALLAKHCTVHATSPGDAAVLLTEEQLKNLAVLLVKGSGYPNVEVSVCSALAMGALGQRDFAIREASSNQAGLLSPVLNALLTNALLRRLDDANAYSCETSQQNKQLRLLEGSMQLMDSCFNAVIDLHTSDDPAFFANYLKLQCAAKLQRRAEYFASQLGSTAATKLDGCDLEKFSETLENVESFIRYKAGFGN